MQASPHNPELLESFLLDAWDALGSFEGALYSLDSVESLKSLKVVSHRLRGTAALYGFEQISKLSEVMERFLDKSDRFSNEQLPDIHTLLESASVCLSSGLEQIAATGQEGQVGHQFVALGGANHLASLIRDYPELFVDKQAVKLQKQSSSLTESLRQYFKEHQEDWSFFAPEAEENIEAIYMALDDNKQSGSSDNVITTLFRATHTLKGAAYMVEFNELGDLAHKLEDLMVKVRDGELELNDEILSGLSDGNRVMGLMLDTAQGKQVNLEAALYNVEEKLAKLLGIDFEKRELEPEQSRSKTADLLMEFVRQNQDVWEYFAPEVRENVDLANEALKALELDLSDAESLHTVFRAMHTLKGAGYMVELNLLGHFAADLELLSRQITEEDQELDQARIDLFKEGNHVLASMLELAEGQSIDLDELMLNVQEQLLAYLPELKSQLVEELKTAAKSEESEGLESKKTASIVRVSADKLDNIMDLAGEVVTLRNRMNAQLENLASLTEVMESSKNRMLKTVSEFEEQYLNPQLSAQNTAQTIANHKPNQASERGINSSLQDVFDELEFDTYNDLNILARSVAEMSNDISEIQDELSSFHTHVQTDTDKLQFLSRQLRYEISNARMVPISQLYGMLRRLLRNTDEKAYRLETFGENVELDNTVLESVTDSLLHLVRNSVTHGIESQEERLAKNKTAEGLINLRAYHRGNHIYIEVEDDGAGINVERVKAKAVERGFRTQAQVDALSDEQACQLIFLAGLSTAESLSTTAGRGVGMDAVADAVKKLKGEINVSTQAGVGSKFSLKLPLTLLISDALMIKVAGQTYGFSSDDIETLQTLKASQVRQENNKTYIHYENETLELISLRKMFGFEALESKEHDIVIMRAENHLIAFEVDEHVGLSEIVVRELNSVLMKLKHVSNATIAPTGEVVILLDPSGLAELAQVQVKQRRVSSVIANQQKLEILLVDDSVSVRRVISKMLGRASYSVTTAGDGQEAMDLFLAGKHFDVVLSDLEMPRMNGYELLEELRRRPDSKDVPIIIMTTRAGDKHRNLALELGANNYFSKPIDESKLVAELKQFSVRA